MNQVFRFWTKINFYTLISPLIKEEKVIVLVKSVCSACDSGWGSLVDWGYGLGKTLGLKTQDAAAIKESK